MNSRAGKAVRAVRAVGTVAAVLTGVSLASACGEGAQPSLVINPADTADQVLIKMSHYVTVEGVRRAHLLADTAFMFQATQTIDLRRVHINFFDAQGQPTSTLASREGTYWWKTGDMEARGNVVMMGLSDGRTLRTSALRYHEARNEVSSERPFTFDGPNRHVEGEGFVSDPNFRDITAKRPHGRGGNFTLPNQ